MRTRLGDRLLSSWRPMLTAFGILSAAAMVVAYGFEARDPKWVVVFAAACLATAVYGFLTQAGIFAVLEVVWAFIAIQRFRTRPLDTSP